MKSVEIKFGEIFGPFLYISIGFIVLYSFLNWLFLIQIAAFSLDEELVNIWLPAALPWIPVAIWIRPRIRRLLPQLGRDRYLYLYEFVAVAAIVAPTIIAQNYLSTSTRSITHITTVSNIGPGPREKYYTIDSFYVDKNLAGIDQQANLSGSWGQYLDLEMFITCPMFNSLNDLHSARNVWYGAKYTMRMNNVGPDNQKRQIADAFFSSSATDFLKRDPREFSYFERLRNSADRRAFDAAIQKSKSNSSAEPPIILKPHPDDFEARSGNKLDWVLFSYAIGSTIWFIMLLFPKLDEKAVAEVQSGRPLRDHFNKEKLSFLLPRQDYLVTPVLIYANTLMFLIMVLAGLGVMSFRAEDLLAWGANCEPYTHGWGLTRLVSSMFLHGGIMHLATNIYGLLLVGVILEPFLGSLRFAVAYFVTGCVASCTSVLYHDATVSVGASGAIFGLFGVLIVKMLKNNPKASLSRRGVLANILVFGGLNLFLGVMNPGIDNAAHVGGLASGLAFGLVQSNGLRHRSAT